MVERAIPEIDSSRCTLCGDCVALCPEGAARLVAPESDETADAAAIVIDGDLCAYCGDCEDLCPTGAIALPYDIVLAPDARQPPDVSR